MIKTRFHVDSSGARRFTDVAYIDEGEDPLEALTQAVISDMMTDIKVRIGDVEMHLAAWSDPEHWEESWAERLEIPTGDVIGKVTEIIVAAAK